MNKEPVFTNWDSKYVALWGNQPICLTHRIHESPLFSLESLAALIQSYPRNEYSIIHMGGQNTDRRFWQEGDLNGLPGSEVIDAIANGRFWLNLRHTDRVDPRFANLVGAIFDELHERVPGFTTYGHSCGILISSPKAQVYYHADLPGHALFQIKGRKRVYFYPPQEPFLAHEHLEQIAVQGLEVDIPYAQWYDDYALAYEFEPGQMMTWPHTAPHRIENHDCLNVSMTLEFSTDAIRRAQMVNLANGILRYQFGWTPRSHAINGPSFWAKAVLQKALRNSSWLKKQKAARAAIEFRLSRDKPDGLVQLSPLTPQKSG